MLNRTFFTRNVVHWSLNRAFIMLNWAFFTSNVEHLSLNRAFFSPNRAFFIRNPKSNSRAIKRSLSVRNLSSVLLLQSFLRSRKPAQKTVRIPLWKKAVFKLFFALQNATRLLLFFRRGYYNCQTFLHEKCQESFWQLQPLVNWAVALSTSHQLRQGCGKATTEIICSRFASLLVAVARSQFFHPAEKAGFPALWCLVETATPPPAKHKKTPCKHRFFCFAWGVYCWNID